MYTSQLFREEDPELIKKIIEENGFGIIVSTADGRLHASHIPMMLEGKNEELYLTGHISKANPHSTSFENASQVLAIFQGPHAYISSSWYNHFNVSTWNYIAVHVYGTLIYQEEQELYHSLQTLTEKYEKHSRQPVTVEQLPDEYVQKQMKGIRGFKIKVEKMEATFKLSQNRDAESYHNIIKNLQEKGDQLSAGVAEEMQKRGPAPL